jgi:hypothetical protein
MLIAINAVSDFDRLSLTNIEGDKNFRSIVTQGGVRLRQAQSDKYEGDKNFRSIVTLSLPAG